MERFPTWRVWRLIHGHMTLDMFQMLRRALRVKQVAGGVSYLSNVWAWVIISFLTTINISMGNFYLVYSSFSLSVLRTTPFTSLSFMIYVLITIVCLRYAVRLTNAIALQREIGNYELFALLPAGEFTNVMNIARAHRHPLQGKLMGVGSALALAALVWAVTVWYPLSLNPTLIGLNRVAYFALPVLVRGMASFVDYLQAFVAATLIAILASQRQKRGEPQLWTIGGFVALQILLYVIVGGLGAQLVAQVLYNSNSLTSTMFLFLSPTLLLAQSVVLIAVREAINFGLWRLVKRQLG